MTDEVIVTRAVRTAMQSPESVLHAMFEAVYGYLDTEDPEALTAFARSVAASVRVHAAPGYEKDLVSAPTRPGPPGRSVEEIFAAHAPRG